jgi:cytosine/adenosine deaminase-related metal-dependent hydrolase
MLAIENASILVGQDLDYVERGYIEIENGTIKGAGSGKSNAHQKIDASSFLVIPAFVNAHTHIADSIGKDIAMGKLLDERVHPVFGAKKKILERSNPDHLKALVRSSAISMLKNGITTFADFREGGPQGVRLLREAILGLPIKCVVLGRVDHYESPLGEGLLDRELAIAREVLSVSDGLGISGANENSDTALEQYRRIAGEKLVAIHAAESKETVEFSLQTTGKREVERIMRHLYPDIIVHMTQAIDYEISLASRSGIVVCPRANGVLGAGLPKVAEMLKKGCQVAIGTDNVMLNSPDMFRELDYLWKALHAQGNFVEPRELVKMATVNGAKMLRLNNGCIDPGRSADMIFIDKRHADLYPIHDPYAAIVHRASRDSITAVMSCGRFLEGIF